MKTLIDRGSIITALIGACIAAAPSFALAQAFPSKPADEIAIGLRSEP